MSYISKICQISIKDHFGPFGQVSLRIQSEYGKIRTRKNSVFGQFSRIDTWQIIIIIILIMVNTSKFRRQEVGKSFFPQLLAIYY